MLDIILDVNMSTNTLPFDNDHALILDAIENCHNIIDECTQYNISDEAVQIIAICGSVCTESQNQNHNELKLLFGLKLWSKYNTMKEIEQCIDENFNLHLFDKKFADHDSYYKQNQKCIYGKKNYDSINEIVENNLSTKVIETYQKNPVLFIEMLDYKFGFCKNKHFNVMFCLETEYKTDNDGNLYEVLNMRLRWDSVKCTCKKHYQKFNK